MVEKKENRDMEAVRAAYRQRMDALKAENERNRVAEEKRKAQLLKTVTEKDRAERVRLDGLIAKAETIVGKHVDTLTVKHMQTVQKDVYGTVSLAKWKKERAYFISRVLYPGIGGEYCGVTDTALEEMVEHAVKERAKKYAEASTDAEKMTPVEYEIFCAELLKKGGWAAILTKASGDQGVDIVADKEGRRIAIQCKKYSSPVGNAAVQEICAGMKFVNASFGMVVSNASFTPQARQLAQSTNVLLLHHADLARIDELL